MQGVTRNPLAGSRHSRRQYGASLAVASRRRLVRGCRRCMRTSGWRSWCRVRRDLRLRHRFSGRGGATLENGARRCGNVGRIASMVIAVVLPRGDIAVGLFLADRWCWRRTYERILPVLPFLLVGFMISLLSARKLNSLALGDELRPGSAKASHRAAVASLGAILLCGATTRHMRAIGFLGLRRTTLCAC